MCRWPNLVTRLGPASCPCLQQSVANLAFSSALLWTGARTCTGRWTRGSWKARTSKRSRRYSRWSCLATGPHLSSWCSIPKPPMMASMALASGRLKGMAAWCSNARPSCPRNYRMSASALVSGGRARTRRHCNHSGGLLCRISLSTVVMVCPSLRRTGISLRVLRIQGPPW
jgi:hypothetical protein